MVLAVLPACLILASITHGPILGDVSENSIRVWTVVEEGSGPLVVDVVEYGGEFPGVSFTGAANVGGDPLVRAATLGGLQSGTRYQYRVRTDDDELGPYDFTTLPVPGQPSRVNLFFSSDMHMPFQMLKAPAARHSIRNKQNTFLAALDVRNEEPAIPALFFSYGDQFDDKGRTEASARSRIKELLVNHYDLADGTNTENGFWHLARYVPTYNVWDDHDFLGSNRTNETTQYVYGRETRERIWRDYFLLPRPAPDNGGGLNFHIRLGNTLIIVLDSRYNNEGSLGTDPPQSGYWDAVAYGQAQMAWARRIIEENLDARFLILVTGTTTVDNVKPVTSGYRDSVGIYHKQERNDFYKYLDQLDTFTGVMVITGDDHFTKIHQRTWVHDEPYDPTDENVDYSSIWRYWFQNLNWLEFKMSMGSCGGKEAPFENFGLGDCFGPPEILAYDRSFTFLQLIADNLGSQSRLTAILWARNTNGADIEAGSKDRSVTKLWEQTFTYLPRPPDPTVKTDRLAPPRLTAPAP